MAMPCNSIECCSTQIPSSGWSIHVARRFSGKLKFMRRQMLFPMNSAVKILVSSLGIALAACGLPQSDVTSTSHAVASELAKAQEQTDARVANARAAARREINAATVKVSRKQARAHYGDAIARADRDLSFAFEKCATGSAGVRRACEINARAIRDQSAETAKRELSLADQ